MQEKDSTLYYLISTRDKSAIRYIGVTCKSINHRLQKHIYDSRIKNTYKDRWIRKEIKEGFEIKIIAIISYLTFKEALAHEIIHIHEAKIKGWKLTNTTIGGNGVRMKRTKKHQKKISDAKRGKKWSDESKKRLSDSRKGMKFSDQHKMNISLAGKGRKHTEETKQKLSKSATGKKLSNETIEIIKKAQTGRTKTKDEINKRLEKINIPVIQLTLTNEFVEKFESAKQAQDKTGIDCSSITKACKGKRKMAGKFKWKYYE